MTRMPDWSELALLLGGVGGAMAWIDNRIGTGKENKDLKGKIAKAKEDVLKAQRASEEAIQAKNRELDMVKEDRDQWKDKALYWQDQAQHHEMMSQKGGPGC